MVAASTTVVAILDAAAAKTLSTKVTALLLASLLNKWRRVMTIHNLCLSLLVMRQDVKQEVH
jgi:hypothetical protein